MIFRPFHRKQQRGFSLPELMVAMTIGLVILAGMATMFVSNSKAQAETEKTNRQVENGRYAISIMSGDLRNAGFYGELDTRLLSDPATLPKPCATKLDDLREALPLAIQGIDNAAAGALGCLDDIKAGTDIVVVRRTGTCEIDTANCDTSATGAPYFQASLCYNDDELNNSDATRHYALDTNKIALDRHQHDCTTIAGTGKAAILRRYKVEIYYVSNSDQTGDGIPTLKRAELGAVGNTISFTNVSQVNGVENLQVEYGIDTGNDGVPDLYTADPSTYLACATDACAVTNWRNVVSVKINVLARNLDKTSTYTDTRSYTLGLNAAGQANVIAAQNDHYKRHVFQSQIVLTNPAGRKAS